MDVVILSIIGIISRLVPHLPNATAVGGLTLFTSSRLGLKKGLIVLLATMLITDLIIGLHPVMWATYGSFVITALLGKYFLRRTGIFRIAGTTFLTALIFYILTNFAVWLSPGSIYPKTTSGLIECYIMALPFFRNTLAGDFIYTFIFFGGYEVVLTINKKFAPGIELTFRIAISNIFTPLAVLVIK